MKAKLNRKEMETLCYKLNEAVEQYNQLQQERMFKHEDAIIKAALEEMWVKCQKKAFENQATYTLDIKPTWAFAMLLQWQGQHEVTSYSGNLLHKLCNAIDQQFA